ncbi:MAG: hypothetical protein NWF06_02325 [Candidatus Bathyarchaeota archaeon]|nr:hypothetical protein [Candidatus Bathyarchaeum sp.]
MSMDWKKLSQRELVQEMQVMIAFLDDLADCEFSKLEDALDEASDYYRRLEE